MKRRRKAILRRRKVFLARLFLLTLLATLIYLFLFKTSIFNIRDIVVEGNNKMTYNEIVQVSGFSRGENIFKIDKKVGKRALMELPYIKSIKVKRRIPKKIIIEVEERESIAAISFNDSFILFDKEGYLLAIKEKDEKVNKAQIFALDFIELNLGENIFEKIENENIKDFIILSHEAGILSNMRYINFTDGNNLVIELKDGIRVAFGPLNNVKYKVSFLFEIIEDIDKKNINAKEIHLNKGDNPIILTHD